MNLKRILLSAYAAVSLLCFPVAAQEEDTAAPLSMLWSGYLQTDDRLNVSGERDFTWQEYRLALRSELKIEKKARLYTEVWVRDLGFAQFHGLSDLQKAGSVMPVDISLRKAYIDIYGVGLPTLDLTIGRQRTVWGTADKINPTDNVDPDDLEDIWDMGRHLGSDGIKVQYYQGALTLGGVFLPIFRPAVLPGGSLANALFLKPPELTGFTINNFTDTIVIPDQKPKESSSAAFKAALHFTGFDASLSYAYCRDDIPLLSRLVLIPQAQSKEQAISDLTDGTAEIKEAKSTFIYPRQHVAGVDMAGMINRFGFWSEAALFIPEKQIDMQTSFGGDEMVAQVYQSILYAFSTQTTALEADPYIKFAAGMDFTFPWGLYLNAQYAHGFAHERGDDMEDYIFFNADLNFFNNKLKLSPFALILEIDDFNDFANSSTWVDQPQVTWRPVENAEIQAGVRLIYAQPGAFFDNMDNGEAFLRVKYSF